MSTGCIRVLPSSSGSRECGGILGKSVVVMVNIIQKAPVVSRGKDNILPRRAYLTIHEPAQYVGVLIVPLDRLGAADRDGIPTHLFLCFLSTPDILQAHRLKIVNVLMFRP